MSKTYDKYVAKRQKDNLDVMTLGQFEIYNAKVHQVKLEFAGSKQWIGPSIQNIYTTPDDLSILRCEVYNQVAYIEPHPRRDSRLPLAEALRDFIITGTDEMIDLESTSRGEPEENLAQTAHYIEVAYDKVMEEIAKLV